MTPAERTEVRDLLSAIHDALDVPRAADYGERETRTDELQSRSAFVIGALRWTLGSHELDLGAPTQTIRGRAAEPLPYTAKVETPEAEATL